MVHERTGRRVDAAVGPSRSRALPVCRDAGGAAGGTGVGATTFRALPAKPASRTERDPYNSCGASTAATLLQKAALGVAADPGAVGLRRQPCAERPCSGSGGGSGSGLPAAVARVSSPRLTHQAMPWRTAFRRIVAAVAVACIAVAMALPWQRLPGAGCVPRHGQQAAPLLDLVDLLVLPLSLPVASAECPVPNCNMHGYCALGGGGVDVCVCNDGWHGMDCNLRDCPKGAAWVGDTDASGNSHFTDTVCSNKGVCVNATGKCSCFTGFTGAACDRMECPTNVTGKICSGHGRCVDIQTYSQRLNQTRGPTETRGYLYSGWDANMIHGCVCDAGWEGYDCTRQSCPTGDDPLSTGTPEVQTVRTTATHTDEVQTFTLSRSGADVNEVQEFYVQDLKNGIIPLTGHFKLTFDTSTAANCALCGTFASQTTANILADASAGDVETALEALSNIDDVTVTRSDRSPNEGYTWTVTFVGTNVGGDVPQLTLVFPSGTVLYGDSGDVTYGQSTTQTGFEVSGYVTLTYDDSNGSNRPVPASPVGSTTSAAIYPYYTAAQIDSVIESMANINTVEVTKTLTGGPGLSFTVTFTSTIGDMIQVTCSDGAFTETCTAATTTDGNYISGTFTLDHNAKGPSAAFTFDQDATTIKNALEAFDNAHGLIDVTRSVYYPTNAAEDVGAYVWSITFRMYSQDVSDISVVGSLGGAGGTEAIAVGTAGSPVTGGETNAANYQINEQQLIECTCLATCSGSFQLMFRGVPTASIAYNADAATLEAAIEGLTTVGLVTITQYGTSGGGEVCDADGVTTEVRFTHNPGDLPRFEIESSSLASSSGTAPVLYIEDRDLTYGLQGGMAKQGYREDVECGNRGECDFDTGKCTCYTGFASSNGAGNEVAAAAGTRQDCGYMETAITQCSGPVHQSLGACNGRGTCSGSPQYTCTCNSGYSGGACEHTDCPSDVAWFDYASATDTAHASAQCSGIGLCDRENGRCACKAGFDGDTTNGDCGQMNCLPSTTCYGQGTCMSQSALAAVSTNTQGDLIGGSYSGWDANAGYGCKCTRNVYTGIHDENYSNFTNPACTELTCLTGDDPLSTGQVDEVQTLTCTATGGTVTLTFRTRTTAAIAYNADAATVEAALEALSSIRNVTVSFDGANTQMCSGASVTTSITFVAEHGDVPALTYTSSLTGGTISVATTTTGTKEDAECSRRGVCNGRTGRCHCAVEYGASDGQGNPGRANDCGHHHARERGAAEIAGTLPINFATAGNAPWTRGLGNDYGIPGAHDG